MLTLSRAARTGDCHYGLTHTTHHPASIYRISGISFMVKTSMLMLADHIESARWASRNASLRIMRASGGDAGAQLAVWRIFARISARNPATIIAAAASSVTPHHTRPAALRTARGTAPSFKTTSGTTRIARCVYLLFTQALWWRVSNAATLRVMRRTLHFTAAQSVRCRAAVAPHALVDKVEELVVVMTSCVWQSAHAIGALASRGAPGWWYPLRFYLCVGSRGGDARMAWRASPPASCGRRRRDGGGAA